MIVFLVNLAGAVALLLWSVRLIRTGVERAFMGQLRGLLRRAARRPAGAALGGAAAALLLQSSTAVAMLAAAFATSGAMPATVGLALLLGADLGSAIVARVLLLPMGPVVPLLLVIGVPLFLRASRPTVKQTGRILTGLALVLIALGMIRAATAPLQESAFVAVAVGYLSGDLVSAFVVGAVLAWAMHSSVAAVLTFVILAAEGMLPPALAMAFVLGANLGGALIPVLLTLSAPPLARRIVTANLALRGGGAVLALAALDMGLVDPGLFGSTPQVQTINAHVAFNLLLALVGLPLVKPALSFMSALLPDRDTGAARRASALDPTALENPTRALACAARELLHMAEDVREMLAPALGLFRKWEPEAADRIAVLEREVDRSHFEIKLYIAKLQEGRLNADQARRALDIMSLANNLEDAGDQVANQLVEHARRMHEKGIAFSDGGWSDLFGLHDCVMSNAQLALNVLMTNDAEAARQLVEEKERIRAVEQSMQARHLDRLRAGNPATIETSNLHQEVVRSLKQINTAFSLVAYPIAEETGDLLSSRLAGAQSAGR